jgi:tellurite methyltransferase
MLHKHEAGFEPSPFLVENVHLLPGGRALDVAMGNGRNAVYLAGKGFTVEGVDLSREAVNAALETARQAGVVIAAKVADLESDYTIEKSAYDVIVCFNYLHRPLIPRIKEALRPGGVAVYETFIIDQRQFGHPNNPDFLLGHNELLDMFREFRCLRYHEGVVGGQKAVAGIVAQKL